MLMYYQGYPISNVLEKQAAMPAFAKQWWNSGTSWVKKNWQPKTWKDNAIGYVKEHPFITGGTALAGVGGLYIGNKALNNQLPQFDYSKYENQYLPPHVGNMMQGFGMKPQS